jgi:hypothetical protein
MWGIPSRRSERRIGRDFQHDLLFGYPIYPDPFDSKKRAPSGSAIPRCFLNSLPEKP